MPQPPLTLRALAKLTGYSLGTVSMSLRGDLRISENTRALILGAADRLGYTPDALFARRMAHVRQRALGHAPIKLAHVVAWSRLEDFYANPPLRDFRDGAADRAAEYGYELEDFHLDEASMSRLRLAGILRARSIPGVLLAPTEQLSASLNPNEGDDRPELDFTAYATIGYTVNIPHISRTVHDHAGALELACTQLRARGYSRIGLVLSQNMHHRVHGRWLAGWVCAQSDPFDSPRPLVSRDLGKASVFDRWLAQEKPDALITADWDVVLAHLKRLGLQTPGDLGLVDLQGSSATTHAAIDQSSREVGAAAVDIIIGQINRHERGAPSIPKTVLVPGRWIEGPTVRPPADSPS
jgi:LacI family transcriptional regulator